MRNANRTESENWRAALLQLSNGKCHGCDVCDGTGCIGILPGMGGVGDASSFINNCRAWNELLPDCNARLPRPEDALPAIGVAPMTGVQENMGAACSEAEFARQLVAGAKKAGLFSCIGDGTPDDKLLAGVKALKQSHVKGTVFLKPYPQPILESRLEWVADCAVACGIDIDSYAIVTMAGKAVLEKKDSRTLSQFKKALFRYSLPLVIKGVHDEEGVQLMEAVKPDCVVLSNHGGRVQQGQEGTAYLLQRYARRLKKVCGALWVDGGLRSYSHLLKAKALGADAVLIGRPFVQGTLAFGAEGIERVLAGQFSIPSAVTALKPLP